MNKQVHKWERYSLASLARGVEDPEGSLFISRLGMRDLSSVVVLHSGLDTVKQLYSGSLNTGPLAEVEAAFNSGHGQCLEIAGHQWLVGSGGKSGYQYRLQNSDLGLILFIKSRYKDRDKEFSHLKIECSPHWIDQRSGAEMQKELDRLAHVFLKKAETNGCSVHICADIQGWDVPKQFDEQLTTYARRKRSFNGGKVLFMDFGEVAAKFDEGQSYLVGSASSVQLAVYRKDIQARAFDKLDFWESVWNRTCGESFDIPAYDAKKPVWRVEIRFHHDVLEDFGRGEYDSYGEKPIFGTDPRRSYSRISGVAKRVEGLWKYGLGIFRLEVSAPGAGRHIDAVWQLLADDVTFREPFLGVTYKRVRKTPGTGNEKNVALALGNWLSIMARNRVTPECACACLKQSGIYDDVFYMMQRKANLSGRAFDESEIFEFIEIGLRRRNLMGKAA